MNKKNDQQSRSIYRATVPQTLDLAERARAGVNFLTEIISEEYGYQPFQKSDFYRNPQVFSHEPGGYVFVNGNEMWGKAAEALLEMRLMSGSTQAVELDEKTFSSMVNCIEQDNLFYSYVKKIEGDNLVEMEDFADLVSGGRVMLALIAKYQLDSNPEWLEFAARLAKGYRQIAIRNDDYAYFPDGHVGGAISRPRSGWRTFAEPIGTSLFASRDWYECASNVLFTYGGIVQGLCQWFRLSNEQESLDLARKLVKFMLKPRFWQPEAGPRNVVSAQHAHFEGHIHATVRGLWGLLEFAMLTNDEQLKAFVLDGYNYVRTFGIARIGLFGEGCTVGDMTCLAIKLNEAGMGDFWEDVDQYVRNHLTELQILNPEPLGQLAPASPKRDVKPWESADRFLERQIGALCDDATHPTLATPGTMHCCTYNGLIGLYHAWKGIVQHNGKATQVNLLLNRASPWLDINSYLPYEGKVIIYSKSDSLVSIRIPRWVNLHDIQCTLNERSTQAFRLNRNLVFEQLKPGDIITLEFPVVESVETYQNGWEGIQIPGWTEVTLPLITDVKPDPFTYIVSTGQNRPGELTNFVCHFKGNTLVEIQPREQGIGYPLYQREYFKNQKAPAMEVTRTVAETLIDI
jgi:hypothetical protein